MPAALHFTGDAAADELIAKDPLALLIGFALDQQITVQTAFAGPLKLKQRLGSLDAATIAGTDPAELETMFRTPPAIHRFPGSMAERLQTLAALVEEKYAGHTERLWTDATSGADLLGRVMELPGFGKQKAQIFVALLAKQLDVRPEGWQAVAGDYALDGYRSVADVVDADSLLKVRAFKQQKKAAAKTAAAG